jgi:membrane associated rhomboid family serine protease
MSHELPSDESGPREVARSSRARRLRDQGLVLQAMGIAHQVIPLGAESALVVAPADELRAREQLELYDRENRAWPAPEELPEVLTEAALGVALWSLALFAMYFVERNRMFELDWWGHGKLIASEVRDGAWWRALTSLTLHDDLVHLVSNVVFGALFVGIVCQVMGTGLALLTVTLAAFAGNVINALVQGDGFSAIGASTAVFAALGLLGGYRALHRPRSPSPVRRRRQLVPLLACLFLLGAYGAGSGEPDSRTDVLGHALGFVSGLAAGMLYARLGSRIAPGRRGQALLGALTLALLSVAWWLALAR